MTLLEAMVAIAIVFGVMGTAIETYRMSVDRSTTNAMTIDAANRAESLLARAGEDLPFDVPERIERTEDGTVAWRLESRTAEATREVQLLAIQSHVRIASGALVVEQTLSTLKLRKVALP